MMKVLILLFFVCAVNATEFIFRNTSPREIWVGCQGNIGHENLNGGGWKLAAGEDMSVLSPDNWSGRFWGRTGCNPLYNRCDTGDCGYGVYCIGAEPALPVTVVEITLKGPTRLDFYVVSLLHGFNTKMAIEPVGGRPTPHKNSCTPSDCFYSILRDCPDELQLKDGAGVVIGCNSPCTGVLDRPNCEALDFPSNYYKYFNKRCPNAQTYGKDYNKSALTCRDAPAYEITFG